MGEAAITGAGSLKARWVIHAASMHLGGSATSQSLKSAIKNSFLRAQEKGARTGAFPAVGAGIAGFPIHQCAEIMMDETLRAMSANAVDKVIFVLHDQTSYDAFREAYESASD